MSVFPLFSSRSLATRIKDLVVCFDGGKLAENQLPNQEGARVIPGPADAHSSNSGVNQERPCRERRGQNRLRGSR